MAFFVTQIAEIEFGKCACLRAICEEIIAENFHSAAQFMTKLNLSHVITYKSVLVAIVTVKIY